MYKFTKVDNKFQWGSEDCFIQFSNPAITLFENKTDKEITVDNILYYYYTLEIFKNVKTNDENSSCKSEIHKIATAKTWDFPCITDFQHILNTITSMDLSKTDNIQTDIIQDKIRYKYQLETGDFLYEDYYAVTKTQIEDRRWYDLFVGCDNRSDFVQGVMFKDLFQEDILELKKCIDEFIKYSFENCVE